MPSEQPKEELLGIERPDYEVLHGDIRYKIDNGGGFKHLILNDWDDGDVIILDEDCVAVLKRILDKEYK